MMSVRQPVGKLAEVLYLPPLGIDELSAFVAGVRSLVQHAEEPLVFVCDWRAVDRFEQTMADTIVWTMRRDNPRVRANGVLVAAHNTTLYDQVAQVLREAKKSERRVFRARGELADFLDPLLTDDERRRRDAFLDENQAATRTPTAS
jgi:hypothetical protein